MRGDGLPTVHALVPATWEYGTSRGKRDFADETKLRAWSWGIILDYPGRSNVIARLLVGVRREGIIEAEVGDSLEDAVRLALKVDEGPTGRGKRAAAREGERQGNGRSLRGNAALPAS